VKVFGWLDLLSFGAYLAFLVYVAAAGVYAAWWGPSVAFSILCLVLWVMARWQLGTAFSAGAVASHLVTGGLYSRLRHPIYVFGTMSFLFLVFALKGPPALVVWALVIAIQVVRARREERVLADAFGADYTAYRDSTWF
jgi:protein-S-isoprenylcysteine O-methyltransferase Ste14